MRTKEGGESGGSGATLDRSLGSIVVSIQCTAVNARGRALRSIAVWSYLELNLAPLCVRMLERYARLLPELLHRCVCECEELRLFDR